MKIFHGFLALVLALAIVGCGATSIESRNDKFERETAAYLQKLYGWLDDADPISMAEEDRLAGRYRFLMTCGYGCSPQGIGALKDMCFSRVPEVTIGGKTDVVMGLEEAALKDRASAFARAYNVAMIQLLYADGKNECPASEEWDVAFDELRAKFKTGNSRDDIAFFPNLNPRGVLIYPPRNTPYPPFEETVCAILSAHGIANATLSVFDYNAPQVRRGHMSYALISHVCEKA